MTVCDCVDMAKAAFTEIIDDYHKNPALSLESIMRGKEAAWKPLFEQCQEETKFGPSIEEELEQCQSFREFRILMDSVTLLDINRETSQNNSSSELCDCLSEAQSEEETQACAPDKSMDELEAIYNDCLNDWEEMENAMEEAIEEMPDMEEALEEEGDKSACDCLKEVIDWEEPVEKAPAGCEWMDNLDDNQLMEELKDCPEMAAMFVVIPEMEDMPEMEDLEEEAIAEEYIDAELMSLRRLDELERLYEEEMEFKRDLQETKLMIRELEDSLLYFDKIPDFDTDLCQCWFNQGVSDLEEDCVDSSLYTLEEEQELYERLWPDCELYDVVQEDLYILIDDYERDNNYLDEALAELDIQIQEEELKLRFIQVHNLEEELRENQELIQELKQDIIAMEQVIDAVDYRTCECILEYYDCTSSLDEINSIKKCDSTLSGEEIRTLCEQCEDRARASDNIWTPEGLIDEHKELEKEKIKKIEEIKKEIEQLSQDFPDIADQLNNEQEKQNTQYKQDTLKLLIEKRFNLDAKLQILKEDLKRNAIVYEDYLSQQYNMQQYIDQDMCDCILSRDEDTYENCTNGLTERDIQCMEEECRLWRDVYYEVGQMQESLFEYSQERVDDLEKKIAELDIEINILRKKFPHFAEKCERNLEENRINQEYTQRIKKWMSPYSFKRRALEKEHTELLNHLNEINGSIVTDVDEILCDCLQFSVPETCAGNYSKKQVDSILSLCEEYSYNDDLFERRSEIWASMMGIESEIGSLNESKINKIKRDNDKVWEELDNLLTNLNLYQYREEKYRFVSNLFDQELEQSNIIAQLDCRLYAIELDDDPLVLKKEFIWEYDLLEELLKKNKKTIKEFKAELYRQSDSLNRISFYKNADLVFKAQEIFSALDEQDLDLFKSLVKQDTIDFFYWTIPSKDFTLEKLKNMSATIENMAGDSTTVKAMDYLNDFKSYDMNLVAPNTGFDRAAGLFGSCDRFIYRHYGGDPWDSTGNEDYQNVSFIDCPNEYLYDCMDPCEEIETLIQDLYRLQDALWCSCIMTDQLWFVFDTSNQKLIGIYDWQWSP